MAESINLSIIKSPEAFEIVQELIGNPWEVHKEDTYLLIALNKHSYWFTTLNKLHRHSYYLNIDQFKELMLLPTNESRIYHVETNYVKTFQATFNNRSNH